MSTAPRDPRSGILFIDKPTGFTSHDVVSRVRRIIGTRKVGHAGTLDPMATGLLIVGINGSTRLLTWLVGLDKEYYATIRLGAPSTTDDAEGRLLERADAATLARVTEESIAAGVAALTGPIRQRPSSVSAIKVDGTRAYALARAGEEVTLAARPVTISTFEVLGTRRQDWIDLDVRVDCSSGTYIRALARDLGAALGVGGHLTALRRTRVGPFSIVDAAALDDGLADRLVSPAVIATRLFGRCDLDEAQAADLANGKRIALEATGPRGPGFLEGPGPRGPDPIAAIGPDGRLVGLVEIVDGRARVLVNFPADPTLQNGPVA